ncbi:hypothetical protein OROGR_000912 [Orobanche gracilis]
MSVRGVWQLQKLVVGFCNWGGSSRGIRVFRSQDYIVVLYCLRQPQASRSTSAEIYVLGLKYKAPAKIDPRLLDVKHLFQGGKEPPKVVDVFRVKKDKRHRVGEKKDLITVDNNEYDDDAGNVADTESEENHEADESSSDLDSEEERMRYAKNVEELLDEAYEDFDYAGCIQEL